MQSSQPSIGDYAAIGDCRSVALVSLQGSIDWFCPGEFSAPSLFGALLDAHRGGRFVVAPAAAADRQAQCYEPGTNVVQTRFRCQRGELELTDFMAMQCGSASSPTQRLVRIARCTGGEVDLQVLLEGRPDYARGQLRWQPGGSQEWVGRGESVQAVLRCSLPLSRDQDSLRGQARLCAGDCATAILDVGSGSVHHGGGGGGELQADAEAELVAVRGWWREWSGRCTFDGPGAEDVLRSVLALKLLCHRETGAVVAASTTSIPEGSTGARNWDYRYCWLRDTSLVLVAFMDLGYRSESEGFMRWLLRAAGGTQGRLHPVYDVSSKLPTGERELGGLHGYHGVGPVRIGNAAAGQVQHDIYGEILLTASEFVRRGGRLDEDERRLLAHLVDRVCDIWRQPDKGIWEIRLPARQNTQSKLMCWTALERSLQLHACIELPIDAGRVAHERDALREDIEQHGFDPAVGSYVGYYGSQAADTSLLLIPRLGYQPATHANVEGTVRHVFAQLAVDGLLYRYPPSGTYDGVSGKEHLFAISNFWAVDCLARQGRVDEASSLYERLLSLRNHVGLYAEEFGVHDGLPIGNFPQAFSHVGHITAALSLAAARQRMKDLGSSADAANRSDHRSAPR